MQNSDEYLLYPGIGTRGGKRHAANVIFQMVQNQIVLAAVAEQQPHNGIWPVQMYGGRVQTHQFKKSEHWERRCMGPGMAELHSQQL